MSFKCEYCDKTSPTGAPQHLVTVETKQLGESTQIKRQKRMCDPCWRRGEESAA